MLVIAKREILFASVTGVTALLAILAMPFLVAKPKLLFGRSLSAISPALFPYVTLFSIVLLSVVLVLVSWRSLSRSRHLPDNQATLDSAQVEGASENDWLRKGAFFFLLAGYGLALKPLGFLISSFVVITATSVMLGNRHWLQIILLAICGPVCLYLIATRLMLVSLPELNTIELFYSAIISALRGSFTP